MGSIWEKSNGSSDRLRHYERNLLPYGDGERLHLHLICCSMDTNRAQGLYSNHFHACLLHWISHDPNRYGSPTRLCQLLLRLLCWKPEQQALRQHHPGPASIDSVRPRHGCADPSIPTSAAYNLIIWKCYMNPVNVQEMINLVSSLPHRLIKNWVH